jgi:hypothetical protein
VRILGANACGGPLLRCGSSGMFYVGFALRGRPGEIIVRKPYFPLSLLLSCGCWSLPECYLRPHCQGHWEATVGTSETILESHAEGAAAAAEGAPGPQGGPGLGIRPLGGGTTTAAHLIAKT